ncbi:hypothetical protein NXH76_10055 [Blautia schinkii]|nr:hypothetical protein [Blautia schinkii]
MEFIAANTGSQTLYIEKDRITAIVEKPVIHKVPGADEKVAGLSRYEGRLAVYLYMEEKIQCECGVLLDTGKKILYGITARDVGVEDIDPALLSAVMAGVWVMRSD